MSSNDYHLKNSSSCIGAAIDSILVGSTMYYCPPTDYEGNPRPNPSGSMPDIGACENQLQNPADIPKWENYTTTDSDLPSDSIYCIEIDELGNKWIGTWGGGLVKFDGTNWTVYNTSNSGLPVNYVLSLAIDGNGNKWIGTWGGGLAKFDGTNWEVYNTSNSDLPDNYVSSIAIDGSGNKWIGTNEGLAKFDGTNWTVYDTSNSGLPDNLVSSLAIDGSGYKWIATYGGLAKFDGTSWTVYNTSKSGLLDNRIRCIAIDESGNKWIGTHSGVAKFDGANWNVYNISNSGLPANDVNYITIDGSGNKWIGTNGGLTVFNEGGIVPVELNSFTVTANGKEVTLNWSTATELNNQGFEIQRKYGSNDFVSVGSVKGNGTTTSPNQYSYVDKLIDGGKYFYRLKQMDFNGTFEYSDVVEVEVRLLDKFNLEQNYPNPFNPTTTIGYVLLEKSNAKLTLLNAIGEEIAVLVNEEQDKGYHKVEFDAANLPSGVYFYSLHSGSFVQTRKMILLK